MSRYFRPLFTKPKRAKISKKPRVRYVLMTALKRTLMVFGAMFFFSIIASLILTAKIASQSHTSMPKEFVLTWTLDKGLIEHQNLRSPYAFTKPSLTVRGLVRALETASTDKRVKGLVVKLEGGSLGLSHIQEIAPAIQAFRESGRFAYIYAPSYGQPGRSGLGSYYLASMFDQIWLQPIGTVSLAGLNVEMPFARGALEKMGIEPQFFARKEYKNVFASFTDTEMSPATKTMMGALVGDLAAQLTGGITTARGLDERALYRMVNQGFLMDQEALDNGVITHLGDFTTLKDSVSRAVTGKPYANKGADKLYVGIQNYAQTVEPAQMSGKAGDKVALIYATGAIVSAGDVASIGPLTGGHAPLIGDDVATDIMDAARDRAVKTIILRIDSPGGSPVASETIRLALLRAKEMGKSVIVSMGATAASGGYWIATPADRIFALPGTLTGSIGVAGGKFVLAELWNKLGINWGSVQYGDSADIWSMNKPFSEAGVAHMNVMMDSIYDAFIARVAVGRDMSLEEADAIARGRVWTGQQALEIGLVDELGGVNAALDYVAAELGLKDRSALEVQVYPKTKTQIEMLVELLSGQVKMAEFMGSIQFLQPIATSLNAAHMQSQYMTYQPLSLGLE